MRLIVCLVLLLAPAFVQADPPKVEPNKQATQREKWFRVKVEKAKADESKTLVVGELPFADFDVRPDPNKPGVYRIDVSDTAKQGTYKLQFWYAGDVVTLPKVGPLPPIPIATLTITVGEPPAPPKPPAPKPDPKPKPPEPSPDDALTQAFRTAVTQDGDKASALLLADVYAKGVPQNAATVGAVFTAMFQRSVDTNVPRVPALPSVRHVIDTFIGDVNPMQILDPAKAQEFNSKFAAIGASLKAACQ